MTTPLNLSDVITQYVIAASLYTAAPFPQTKTGQIQPVTVSLKIAVKFYKYNLKGFFWFVMSL